MTTPKNLSNSYGNNNPTLHTGPKPTHAGNQYPVNQFTTTPTPQRKSSDSLLRLEHRGGGNTLREKGEGIGPKRPKPSDCAKKEEEGKGSEGDRYFCLWKRASSRIKERGTSVKLRYLRRGLVNFFGGLVGLFSLPDQPPPLWSSNHFGQPYRGARLSNCVPRWGQFRLTFPCERRLDVLDDFLRR